MSARKFWFFVLLFTVLMFGTLPLAAQSRNLTVAVLLNSQNSAGYNTSPSSPGEYQRAAERYLQHLQVPYEIFDVSSASPPADLSDRELIIAAHSGLNMPPAWRSAISAAVSGGTGFVNLDSNINIGTQSHIQAIFGATGAALGTAATQISVPTAVAPGGATPHFIAALQRHWDDPNNSLVYPFHADAGGVTRSATATVLQNATGTVIARLGNDPLILATNTGTGRAVHFGTMDYLRGDRFGFVQGIDDLFWRSLVWAARKPFVLRGYPRLFATQMDDTRTGWGSRVRDLYNQTFTGQVSGDGMGGPWKVTGYLFTDNLPRGTAERAGVIADINAGLLEVSPHSFADVSQGNMYWNNVTGALTDAQWQTSMNGIDSWKQGNGGADVIPSFSRSMVPHFWNLSNNTGNDMWNRYGFRYITTIQKPGFKATDPNGGAERIPAKPFWNYEMPPKTFVGSYTSEDFDFIFADDFVVQSRAGLPSQTFFLFATQYLDFAKYQRVDFSWPRASVPTGPGLTPAESAAALQQYTWRFWSGLSPVQLFTHDAINYENALPVERQTAIIQSSAWLNSNGVRHTFMDNLGDYIYARTKSTLSRASFDGAQLSYTFTGRAADVDGNLIPTQVLLFQGDTEGSWQSVPGFTTGLLVTRSLPATVQSVSPTSGSSNGGTTVTITGTGFTSASTVYFGQGTATNVTLVNSSTLQATTPAGALGSADVRVVNTNGTATLPAGYTYTPPPRVLVAAYAFNEGVGTTVGDSSGNGNNGTVSSTTWNAAGKFGSALSFNGTSSWVTIPDSASLDLTTGMTLEAWVRPTTLGTVWRTAILKEQASGLVYGLYANTDTSRPSGHVFVGSEQDTRGTAALPLNAWTHLALTYDGTTLRLYVNGVEASNKTLLGNITASTGVLRIGGNGVWGEFFSGLIDEVRIFNRASTPAEIQGDMNAPLGDTTPPTVAMTAPANGATVSGSVTVSANASDNVAVAGVQFLLDGNALGAEDTAAPYSTSWNSATVANGTHTLAARARDGVGNLTTSVPVSVTVSNAPDTTVPVVSMTAPADGATVSGSVTVSANASDNVGVAGVQFLLDGNALGAEDTTAPYSVTWNAGAATAGPHTLSARARDAAGNQATSAVVNVTNVPPDTTAPVVSMTAPANGASVTGTVTVSADASDNIGVAGVQFLLDGNALGAEDTTAPYSTSWNASTATNGSHTLSARARDAAGNQTTSSTVSVTVTGGVTSGLVMALGLNEGSGTTTADISGNSNNGTLTNGTAWTAGKFGNGVNLDGVNDNVTVANSASLALGNTGTVEAWVRLTSVNRWNAIIAKGTANDDRTHNFGIEVTNTNRFTCVIGNGSAFRSLTSTAVAAANQLYHVACLWNGTNLQLYINGALDTSVAQNFTPAGNTAPVTIGQYGGTADNFAGMVDEVRIYSRALSASEVVADMNTPVGVADTTPPSVAMSAPANGATVSGSVTVSATASDNVSVAGVQFLLDGNALGTEDTSTPYSITWNSATVANGPHTLAARARDGAGNQTTSASISITTSNAAPDTSPPTVSMTAPAAGATLTGAVTVSANASDNVGVAGVQFLLDGVNIGAEDTTSPYSINWDTGTATNGTHNISARARDAAGNQATSAPVSVTVSNAVPPTTGLVAAYSFNEGSGNTVGDVTGNGNNGTVANTTWTPNGRDGAALSFNGTSSWVTVPDAASLDLTTGMTLEAWVNPTALGGVWRTAVMKEQNGGLAYGLYANTNTNVPSGHIFVGGEQDTRGTAGLPLNTWSHIAVTYNGTVLRMVVNGVETSNKNIPGSILVSTGALRIGGNGPWGEFFTGLIDEVRVYNRALSIGEIQTDMNTPLGAAPPPDNSPPSVSVLGPASGTTIAGLSTLYATASDDVGVTGVQFFLDGAPLGAEIPSPPFTTSWNTTTATNASHTITAVARDLAGNLTTSAPATVTVSNTNDPAVVGSWTTPFSWPIVAVHMIQLRTGEVLSWDGPPSNGGTSATIWNPSTGVFTAVPNNRSDMFCDGMTVLSDGRVLALGGHSSSGVGIPNADIYDPVTRQWTAVAPMNHPRWYPTATMLPDGRAMISSGSDNCYDCMVNTPEIYNPSTNTWTQLTAAATNPTFYYPLLFVLPDGRLLEAGATETSVPTVTRVLNLSNQTWTAGDPDSPEGHSAVMYELGKFMKSGATPDVGVSTAPSISTTYTLDMTQPNAKWQQTPNLAYRRAFHVQTLLPDGTVLATGGGSTRDGIDYANSVFAAELWSPDTKTWRTMASAQNGRLYHGNAVLLLDGRVLVAGSGRLGAAPQFNAEIFSPPYLFKGPRPTISSIPASAGYGSTFFVGTPNATAIISVTLLRLSATTHAFDTDQRILRLSFSQAAGGLNVVAPANSNVAPPGYYGLFILNGSGVPSIAGVIRIN